MSEIIYWAAGSRDSTRSGRDRKMIKRFRISECGFRIFAQRLGALANQLAIHSTKSEIRIPKSFAANFHAVAQSSPPSRLDLAVPE